MVSIKTVFAALLIGWIAVALSRVFSIMVDGTEPRPIGGCAFEVAFGGILALGFASPERNVSKMQVRGGHANRVGGADLQK